MRKFISIIFISLFCSNVTLAAITCTQSATDKCEAGCYISNNFGCIPCDTGTYTNILGQDQCLDCEKPTLATFTTAGTAKQGCQWTITCAAGTRFVNKGNSSSGCFKPTGSNYFFPNKRDITGQGWGVTEGGDYECSTNSTPNSDYTGCICDDGYHLPGMENDDTDTTANNVKLTDVLNQDNKVECVPNDYKITYDPNNNKDSPKTTDVEFNQVIDLSEQIKELYNPIPTKEGYNLSSWIYKEDTYAADAKFTYLYTDNITLTAQWTGKQFTVTYKVGNAVTCYLPTQTCNYGTNCLASSANNCIYTGYVFRGWKCTNGCNNTNTTITIGADISTMSNGNDMELTAIWEICPAGKYCTNVASELSCPAGSTSDAGSSAITECYMTGGTTQICDGNNNCFTLPASAGNIYYHGGQ